MTFSFRTIIEQDEDGTYRGFVPALSGCQTWGWDSFDKAREKLREAMRLYIDTLINAGESVPTDKSIESIETIHTNPVYA